MRGSQGTATAVATGLFFLMTALVPAQGEAISGRATVAGGAAAPASTVFTDGGLPSVARPAAGHAPVDVRATAGASGEATPGILPDSALARFSLWLTLVLAALALSVRLAAFFVLLRSASTRSAPVPTGRSSPQHPPSRFDGCARSPARQRPTRRNGERLNPAADRCVPLSGWTGWAASVGGRGPPVLSGPPHGPRPLPHADRTLRQGHHRRRTRLRELFGHEAVPLVSADAVSERGVSSSSRTTLSCSCGSVRAITATSGSVELALMAWCGTPAGI